MAGSFRFLRGVTSLSKIRPAHLNELQRSLVALRELLPRLPEGKRMSPDGTTAAQIAFHTSEAADFWLRNVILGDERPRDRDAEFTAARDAEALLASATAAIAACALVVERAPELEAAVSPPPTMTEGRAWSVLDALLHMTGHTAGHVGELTVVAG
jgi:uncharacterized damage-inducible protein DinB